MEKNERTLDKSSGDRGSMAPEDRAILRIDRRALRSDVPRVRFASAS